MKQQKEYMRRYTSIFFFLLFEKTGRTQKKKKKLNDNCLWEVE